MAANRIFYAVQQVGVAPYGSNTYTSIHGLQQLGMNTTFNLEQVFEIGQISIYQNIENIPDIEVTLEKVLDGYPLIYHLCTHGATSPSLSGRQNRRSMIGVSVYNDTNDSASGVPISQCTISGAYVSSLTYTFPVDGNATEQVTLVANNKYWDNTFTATNFNNNDSPLAPSGVQRRQDVMMGSGASKFPRELPGIGADGYNHHVDGGLSAHIQTVRVTTNLGRESLYELGRRGPYFRYATFPTEVRTEIEMTYIGGDGVTALEDAHSNVFDQEIVIKTRDGGMWDLGTKNMIASESYGGANAGRGGGNATMSYSYLNYNNLTVTHPADPSGL